MTLQYVPIIDLAPYFAGTPEGKLQVACAVDQACRDIGFLVITNHQIPTDLVERVSRLTRTDQKFGSWALSSLWKLIPLPAGSICKSKAVALAAFCSSPVRRARLVVKVSAMRNCIFINQLLPLYCQALLRVWENHTLWCYQYFLPPSSFSSCVS